MTTDGSEQPLSTEASRARVLRESVLVSLAVFALLLVAIHQYALAWDEGYTFKRLDALGPWIRQAGEPANDGWSKLFTRRALDRHWRFSREEPDGHGPFYALLSLSGHGLTHRFLTPPASYRVGSISLFALAVGSVYATLRRRWGGLSSLVTVGLLASMPRALPEVCYALIDGPLLSLSLLAWCAFARAAERGSWLARVGFGVVIGLAMATKLTGWFLLFPYLAYAVWLCDRRALVAVAVGAATALGTVFVVNVGWWPDPIGGIGGYFVSNLTRRETIAIDTRFLGVTYPFSLPWYNTLVWTFFAVPAGTLALGIIGIAAAPIRRKTEPIGMLLLANWGLLMVLRALPQAPGHDGTRQILIAFGFFALLAGYGFHYLHSLLADNARWGRGLLALIAAASVGESVTSAVVYHPLQLSYYSPLVGGLPGATRLGMEPTYFWDSVTPEVLDWLDRNTTPGRCVLFRNNPESWRYLRRWSHLNAEVCADMASIKVRSQWYVIQHRPGLFLESDRWLIEHATPAFRKEKFGVPLLSIYSAEQWAKAMNHASDPAANQEAAP